MSLMRLLRLYRAYLVTCGLVLLLIFTVHHCSNVFDLLFHFISPESYGLPLSLHCNQGRLGNQMCSYATLYGLSALNRRKRFVVLECNIKFLDQIFMGPSKAESLWNSLYSKWHAWSLAPYLMPADAAIPSNSNFLNGHVYPCSYTFFDHVREGIRQEFQFQEHLQQHAQAILQKANSYHRVNVTYVGVHVRRGDYNKEWLEAFEGVPVNMEYFRKALTYFREKYRNVIFIAVSDDRLWCKQNLAREFGAFVPLEAPSPAHDLAVLANCNHTVMTYGTFGFWGAYLAGGEVLYFDKFLKPNTTFSLTNFRFDKMYPPDWKGIVTVNSSYWSEKVD